jgi:hypothetical protein
MQDDEYPAYLKAQSYDNLVAIRCSIDKDSQAKRYEMIMAEMAQREEHAETTKPNYSSTSNGPIYSPQQIFVGSFLGGPIALVYFLHFNFQKLGNKRAASQTLLWGIVFNIAILAALPFLPKDFPRPLLPLAYSWFGSAIAKAKQLRKESIAALPQFRFQSNWVAAGYGAAFLVGTLVLWFSVLLFLFRFHIIDN